MPQGIFRHFRLYPQFRGNAENSPFLMFLAPAPRRKKISGNCLVRLKDNCPGFQKTPLEIMSGVSLHIFFMPKLKSFGVAPTSPIWFSIESGCQYPRLTMKLPVKVRVSRKKIAFFVFRCLVPPTGNMGGRKRVRSDKADMPNFLASDLDFYPPPISL